MNKENARRVLVAIQAEKIMKFDMSIEMNACGTAGCIAGFAALLAAQDAGRSIDDVIGSDVIDTAADFLDINPWTAQLFTPNDFASITKWEAVEQMRHIAQTGEMRPWSEITGKDHHDERPWCLAVDYLRC